MSSRVEPVAVTDVVTALVGALTAPAVSRHFDLGSGERMEYAALLRLYADRAGLRRVQVSVPGLPTALVSRLAPALTRAPASTVQSLVESLHHDMVCGRQDFMVQLMPPEVTRSRRSPRRSTGRSPSPDAIGAGRGARRARAAQL